MTTPLAIKGIHEGLLIQVPEGEWRSAERALLQAIDERSDFFRGANVALQMEERELDARALERLREALVERQVSLRTVLSLSPVTKKAAAVQGLASELPKRTAKSDEDDLPIDTELAGEEAVLVQRTLRSGNIIRHPGHVIVLGDVNPGAEIIAGGHVIVWGRLRGTAHAGAAGDPQSYVCALDLSPTQLRIAGQISVSPDRKSEPKPEMARLRKGQVVAEPWRQPSRK